METCIGILMNNMLLEEKEISMGHLQTEFLCVPLFEGPLLQILMGLVSTSRGHTMWAITQKMDMPFKPTQKKQLSIDNLFNKKKTWFPISPKRTETSYDKVSFSHDVPHSTHPFSPRSPVAAWYLGVSSFGVRFSQSLSLELADLPGPWRRNGSIGWPTLWLWMG